jgi:uncharacterized protein with WD repeat
MWCLGWGRADEVQVEALLIVTHVRETRRSKYGSNTLYLSKLSGRGHRVLYDFVHELMGWKRPKTIKAASQAKRIT